MNEAKSESCEYCFQPGIERVPAGAEVKKPIYVCNGCWKLLKDPKTALPLIRGNMALNLRGKMPQKQFDEMANKFFEELAGWKPRN